MKKDELGPQIIQLSAHQENSAIFKVVRTYFEERLDALRLEGDGLKETQLESMARKGRIAEIKEFLKASEKERRTVMNKTKVNY